MRPPIFGNIALLAVGIIVISGVATTALIVRDVPDLTAGTYVALLAVKLALFCLMLVLAAVNRLKLVPRVAASNYTPAAIAAMVEHPCRIGLRLGDPPGRWRTRRHAAGRR